MLYKKRSKLNILMILLLSFFIPATVAALSFARNGIVPGGDLTLLTYDLRFQLLPLYGYLHEGGPGFDGLLYSMSGGLGGGFLGTIAYNLSFFDLIYSLIPIRILPDAIYFMIIGKIGLCGVCFGVFLLNNSRFNISDVFIIIFSSCYALTSYNITYFVFPVWYDAVICLPLLACLLEKVIIGCKSITFVCLMTFCIIDDYYMAYIVAISLVLYFVFRIIEEKNDFKTALNRFMDFAFHGILSCGLSLFVLIPVVLDLRRGKLATGGFATTGSFIKNSFFDVIINFIPQSYSGFEYDASPNVYCGTIVLILALVWFVFEKRNLKARIAGLCIVLIYFLSFILAPLDRIWHGFRDPVCFSCRYAFTFVFFLICFSVRGFCLIKYSKKELSSLLRKLIYISLLFYTFIELYFNASFILAGIGEESVYSLRKDYDYCCDVAENLIPYSELDDPLTYGRLIADYRYTNNDNELYGYDGFGRFSSSYNYNISYFFRSLGVNCAYHTMTEEGFTPPSAGLINVRFLMAGRSDFSDFYNRISSYNGVDLYYNNNSMPLAFNVPDTAKASSIDLSADPFSNMNIVYEELTEQLAVSGDLFIPEEYATSDDLLIDNDENNEYKNLVITANHTGHYFMIPVYEITDDDSSAMMNNLILNQYGFCIDLGYLEKGNDYAFTVEADGRKVNKIFLYYYNDEYYREMVSNVNGYNISSINGNGIILEGNSPSDMDVLITLPFEDGYNVYVDGNKTTIESYRDAFIIIPVSEGNHDIVIKYSTPGLRIGLLTSVIFALIAFIYFVKSNNSLKIEVKDEIK